MSRRINKNCPRPDCAQKKYDERELFSHYKNAHMIYEFACAECFTQFAEVSELSNHFENLHPSLEHFRYIAAEKKDGLSYPGYEILQRIKLPPEPKHTPREGRFLCSLCSGLYKTVELLQIHCITSHEGNFLTCSRCLIPLPSLVVLKDHICQPKPNKVSIRVHCEENNSSYVHDWGQRFVSPLRNLRIMNQPNSRLL